MTSIRSMRHISNQVLHLMRDNSLYRENELALILRIGEMEGHCQQMRINGEMWYCFSKEDVLTGRIPNFYETIRRVRQQIQHDNVELRPSIEIQVNRRIAQKQITSGLYSL